MRSSVPRSLKGLLASSPTRRRTALAGLCVTLALAGILLSLAATHRAAASPRRPSPVTKKLLACERVKNICNRTAWRRLPLRQPDANGAALLTEAQAIAEVGWQSGDSVGALQMTYGQAATAYPGLASSNVTAPSRVVWVVTLQLAQPVPGNSLSLPPGQPVPMISAFTVVIDAVTGNETDWCAGCSSVPVSAAATHIAKSHQ